MSITTTRLFNDLLYVAVVQLLDGPHKMHGWSHYLIMKTITQGFQGNEVGHEVSSKSISLKYCETFPITTRLTKSKSLPEICLNKGIKVYSNKAPSLENEFLELFYFPHQH